MDLEQGVRRWDRARWISVFSSHNPTIREVTECLGLGLSASSSTTNRGIPKFDNPDYRKLSSEVTKLSKELPKERDALLDFAADPLSLDRELEELLESYGPAIWSKGADRSCLLTPDRSKKTYTQDLFYEIPEHKEILKIHLHRWIIIKACYYIRNMKLKRPSNANDYDSLADFDGEGNSSHGTPQSLTPPERGASMGADFSVKPVNLKKRKSSAHMSMSDGEDVSPAKRPYSTMPSSRKSSPRMSLKSLYPAGLGSRENMPPFPPRVHHLSPPPASGSEAGRVQLSPLTSSELNGAVRQVVLSQSAKHASFTAVNSTGFTAVNTSPPLREARQEAPGAASKEPQQVSPVRRHRHTNSYTSPYDPAPPNSTVAPNSSESRSVPPMNTAPPTTQEPQTTLSGQASSSTNGTSSRESPKLQHAQLAYIAPQSQPPQPLPSQHQLRSNSQPHYSPFGGRASVLPQPPIQSQSQLPARPLSRTDTPGHTGGRALAAHPPRRSSTPLAQAANHQSSTAPNTQAPPAPPNVQSAAQYGVQLVPTRRSPTPPKDQEARPVQAPHILPHHQHHHQPMLKSQAPEHAQIPQPSQLVHRPMIATHDIRLLQYEVTAGLFTFFYPRTTAPPDEPSLLQRLHTLWYHGESIFRTELGPHFDLVSKVLTAWLLERQAITALRHSLASQPGVSHAGLVDRLLAMNDLRVMRLKWKNMSTIDGLSPEDLLCQAFRVMTNTEGSEYLFKDGLDRLNSGVFDFLRSEDAKITMQRR